MLHKLQNVIRHIAQTEVMPRFLNTPSFRKEDGSMLSEADLAAQTAFAAALPLLIGCPMLGEEMTAQQQADLWHNHSDGLFVYLFCCFRRLVYSRFIQKLQILAH